MKKIKVKATDASLAKLVQESETVLIVDEDGATLGRYSPVDVILTAREKARLQAFPHEPDECFGTCWRHDKAAEEYKISQLEPV